MFIILYDKKKREIPYKDDRINMQNKNNFNFICYIVFKNDWPSGMHFTWTKSNNMFKVGSFYGTGEELIKKAYADSETIGRNYERYVKIIE